MLPLASSHRFRVVAVTLLVAGPQALAVSGDSRSPRGASPTRSRYVGVRRRTNDERLFDVPPGYRLVRRVPGGGESDGDAPRVGRLALDAVVRAPAAARVHRSALVYIDRIRELRALSDGEYQVLLTDGTKLGLSRTDRVDLPSF